MPWDEGAKQFWYLKCVYLYPNNNILDLKAEIKWIGSMRKVKESSSQEQLNQDALMLEAEADIKAGRVYSTKEAHKIVDTWEL